MRGCLNVGTADRTNALHGRDGARRGPGERGAALVVADEFRDGSVPARQEPLRRAQMAFAALPASVTQRYFSGGLTAAAPPSNSEPPSSWMVAWISSMSSDGARTRRAWVVSL